MNANLRGRAKLFTLGSLAIVACGAFAFPPLAADAPAAPSETPPSSPSFDDAALARLYDSARLVSSYEKGRLIGVRIFGMKGITGWTSCGVRNGDIIVERAADGSIGPAAIPHILRICVAKKGLAVLRGGQPLPTSAAP